MPVFRRTRGGRDFFQCGTQGAEYYVDDLGEKEARQKAINQCLAMGEPIQVIERQKITKPLHRPEDKKKKVNKGLMIGFWVPPEIGAPLALPGGEPPESLHLTLTFHGNSDEIGKEKIEQVLKTAEAFAQKHPPMEGILSGIGRFNASESSGSKDVVYLSYDAPALPHFRQELVNELNRIGAPPFSNHGYTPHITLAYIDQEADTPIKRIENNAVQFDQMVVTVGDEHYPFDLQPKEPKPIHDAPIPAENERGRLRQADPLNEYERCLFCRHFESPTVCQLLEGPVTQDHLCDYIDSTGMDRGMGVYFVAEEDFLAFGLALMAKQPLGEEICDVMNSKDGWIIQLEDGNGHYYSQTKDEFIQHTSINHHWTQTEVNELVMIGRQILEGMEEGEVQMMKSNIQKAVQKFLDLPLAPRGRSWDADGAEQRVRRAATNGDGDIDFNQYGRSFLWSDPEKPDEITGYKLQYADIINGQLQAVPRALFAIAAVLQGSRGGTNIPAADQNRIKGIVSRYYGKMASAFEDDSIVAPWETQKGSVKKEYTAAFIHKDADERLVYGIVLEPNTIDAQDDFVTDREIETAAHNYMLKSQTVGNSHKSQAQAKVVQSYIAPADFELGGQPVRKGSWVMVTKIFDDQLWQDVQNGNFTGYSIGGYGNRTPAQT